MTTRLASHARRRDVSAETSGRMAFDASDNGLARLSRLRQRLGVDVDHHLVALAGGAGIKPVVEGRLREQDQRIGPLLGRGREIAAQVSWADGHLLGSGPLVPAAALRSPGWPRG